MFKIPIPGEVYEQWDGETVQVVGLCHDEEGTLCVEYEIRDAPGQIVTLGDWFGVERSAPFPHPMRFLLAEDLAEEDNGVDGGDPPEPPRSAKLLILETALSKPDAQVPFVPVKGDENGGNTE